MANLPAMLGGDPVFSETLPITRSTLPEFAAVADRYQDVFATGMVTNHKYVQEFERLAAERLGVNHAVGVSSCTSGLLLTLKTLGLQGEVVLPSFTFSVTGHVLAWNVLKPVYVDIDPETCLIDPAQVERAITPETCAIIGVHIWGNPCPADALEAIAERHGVPLVFDAAQATGSRYLERPVGGFGTAEVFSCSPTKVVTSGEGGIVATNDEALAQKIRVGRNYGDDGSYDCEFEGINARMSELHAIVGVASMEMLDDSLANRLRLIELYKERLGRMPGIRFQKITPGGISNGVYFSLLIEADKFGMTRDQLYEALKSDRIDTRRYYHPPLHQQKVNAHLTASYAGKLPNTELISSSALTLPLFSHMKEAEAIGVCEAIERLHEHREQVVREWPAG